MHRRKRFAIGLVLLAAMTFSFVETAVAARCLPMADMGAMDSMPGMPGSPASHDDAPGDRGPTDGDHPGSNCPFTPVGGAQSCVSASLPASRFDLLASPSAIAAELTRTEIEPHLVLTSVPFHPPKS